MSRLRKGEIVCISSEGDTVAYKLKNHDWVITAATEETTQHDITRSARGALYLINEQLSESTEADLTVEVRKLEAAYGFKFDLRNRERYHEDNPGLDLIWPRGVTWAWYSDGADNEVFLLPVRGESYVVVTYGFDETFVNFLLSLAVVIFIVALALGILTWLWPVWKDHKTLTKKVLEFGQGKLDSRVKLRNGAFAKDIAESFNTMANNIQQLIGANQQLTNAVAHDLRTPLARLRFANEILASGECTPEESQRYRQTINSSIEALDYLINQTLLHSRYARSTDIKHFKCATFSNDIKAEVEQFDFDYERLEFVSSIDNALDSHTTICRR